MLLRSLVPVWLLVMGTSCVLIDRPLLGLRSVAGGLHNARQVSGIRPFFLADGRLGVSANGGLALEREPSGEFVPLLPGYSEVDDPDAAPDGSAVVFVSGRDVVSAGGGHKDHVFQLYSLDLGSGEWRRLTTSRRAESLPRFTEDGEHIVFVRRAEYDGWSLYDPWGPGSLFVAEADGTHERRLSEGLFHPFVGLDLAADDSCIVFGARPAREGAQLAVWVVDYPQGGEPRMLIEDAYLPTPIPGTRELLVARIEDDGHRLVRVDLEGRLLEELEARADEFGGLAVSPDGTRIAYSDFDPQGGSFGQYRLWSLEQGAARPELIETLPYRLDKRFKPLDLVKPPSWWFCKGRSPGSR